MLQNKKVKSQTLTPLILTPLIKNVFLGLILITTISFASTTLRVGDCEDATYTTITDATYHASAGDTIEVCSGTYNESIETKRDNLTIKGLGSAIDDVIIKGSISLNSKNITFDNFKIKSNSSGIEGHTTGAGSHTFKNLIIESKDTGIYVSAGGKQTFQNLTITSSSAMGIHTTDNVKGDHTFDHININSAQEALYIGHGGTNFTNLDLNSTGSTGLRIDKEDTNTNKDVNFSHININTPKGMGIIFSTTTYSYKTMRDINITSKGRSIYSQRSLALLTDANLTSSDGIGLDVATYTDLNISNVQIHSKYDSIIFHHGGDVNINVEYSSITSTSGTFGSAPSGFGIDAEKASNLTVKNLCINSYNNGINILTTAKNAHIINNKITSTHAYAISVTSDHSTPATINNNCLYGDKLAQSNNSSNNFDSNYWDGVSIGSDGKITHQDDTSRIDDHVVDNSPNSSCGTGGCSGTTPIVLDTNTSLCYDEPVIEGFNIMGFGMFYGVTTPIKNVSNTNITDANITKTFDGINMSFMNKIAIDDDSKTIAKDSDQAEKNSDISGSFGEFNGNLFNKGFVYRIGNFGQDETHTIYDYSMFSFNMSKIKIGAEYTKNGQRYYAVLHSCGGEDNNNSNNIVNPVCGTFQDVLQTRNDPSNIHHSSRASANIYNNPDCTLNTENIDFGSSQHLICNNGGDATASGTYGNQLNINYNFSVKSSTTASSTSSGSDKEVTSANENLTSANYNKITQDWHKYSFSLNANNAKTINNLYQILNTVQINNLSNQNLNIGNFSTGSYSSTSLILNSIPNNIYINTLQNNGSNDLTISNFEATQSIEIGSLNLGSSQALNLTIKAPKITINNLHSTNDYNNITLYADEININSIIFAQHSNLIIHPYTPGNNIKFYSNSITASSSSTMILDSGSYYTNSFDIPGSSNVSSVKASDLNQIINFFINGDFIPGNNPGINSDGNSGAFGSLPPANFLFFVNGDLETGGGGTTFNATVYVEGSTTFGSPSYLKGALSSGGSIEIGNDSKFYYDQSISDAGWGQCSAPITYITGPFDAWDNILPSRGINDRNISTKMVNKDFNLTIASLNSDNNATEAKDGINMQYQLYDAKNDHNITSWEDYNATTGSDGASSIKSFLVNSAKENVRVRFKFCAFDTGTGLELASLNTCTAGSGDYNSSYDLNTSTFSSDNFAIRPYAFKVFGENQYKRAGEDFNLTIKAIDENNNTIASGTSDDVTGILDYNKSTSNLNITSHFYTPNSANIAQMQSDTGETNVTGCPNTGTFTISNTNFSNGEANVTLNFSETGILDVNISEQHGQEFAKVDEDDTNDSQRYIKPAVKIYDKSDISKNNILLFIPYSFTTTATYNTTNSKNWLYINDINKSNSTFTTPKMAAYLAYTIKAYNKNGILTKNYTKTCFPDVSDTNCPRVNGLKLNTTFDLFLDMDINSTADTNLSLYSEDNTSSAIWAFTKNQSILQGQNSIREWISPKQFENGVGQAKVYFNIDRNLTKAVNPIIINVIDVNTSTSWMSNPGSPKDFNGALLDVNKTFYYGRVHAPDYRFEGNNGNATIYYEVYSDQNQTTRNSFGINGSESVDSIDWYINTLHANSDGNVSKYKSISNVRFNATNYNVATPTQDNTANINLGEESIILVAKNTPYKDKIDMNSSSWLIYNPTDFMVEFDTNGSWAGQGIQGQTVDLNISKKQNRRLDW